MASGEFGWWVPQTEQDLADAIDLGLLEETHFLELKQQIDSGTAANKELARDLSALGIDGGLLIIGVAESDEGPSLHPVDLHQLPEKIEQIARSSIQPRLDLSINVIPSVNDPAKGYIVVRVHPSLRAPHMVGDRYYGRGDKSKYVLDDAEVSRLHRARDVVEADAAATLDWLIARDPIPPEITRAAHYFFIARPLRSDPELAVDMIRQPDYWEAFREILSAAARRVPNLPNQARTSLIQLTSSPARRADGVALTGGSLGDDRRPTIGAGNPNATEEVELAESGEVRIFVGELSRERRSQSSDGQVHVILDDWVPELTREGIEVAAAVGNKFGYRGPWFLGVAITGLAGLTTSSSARNFMGQEKRLEATADDYRAWTQAPALDVHEHPGRLTGALVGRFLRSAGIERFYLDNLLADPEARPSGG